MDNIAAVDLMRAQAAQASAPRAPQAGASRTQIRAAAEEMEGFFLSQTLEALFAGIKTDGPFGGGHGEAVFRSLLLQEYGKQLADQGGLGLADQIERELLRQQEITP
jgi:Rod binding domain-containing protein